MDRDAIEEKGATGADSSAPADARAAGLRYVDDRSPGITRTAVRQGFRYARSDGTPIDDESELARIRALVIPPAWTDVWICRWRNGHLQATGRYARGRKQYRYHPQWRNVRDEAKYERMLDFGQALPIIRSRIDTALSLPGLPREKVLAAIVYLLQATLMRIGNREYARDNDSYGMTTLRKKHVRVDGTQIRFEFRGKSGIRHSIRLQDRRLARIIMRTRDLPGQELFQYVDEDGQRHAISSTDVNDYLRELTGQDYTAKDFRTWAGTVLAAMALLECEPCSSETQGKKNVVQAIAAVAQKLGNTPAICRKCYVHPRVIDAYMEGTLKGVIGKPVTGGALSPEETMVLEMLEKKTSVASTTRNGTHQRKAA